MRLGKPVSSQLLLFDTEPEAALPDLRRRTLTEAELGRHLRHLQANFDARTQYLPRCADCQGFVESVDAHGFCEQCTPARGRGA
jgi:hypothetical protein